MSWHTARGYCWARAMRLLGEHPGRTLVVVLLAGIALAVPVTAFMFWQAVRSVALSRPVAEISVFVAPGTASADAKAIADRLAALAGVANVRLVSGEQAWSEMRGRSRDSSKFPEPRVSALPDLVVAEFAPGTAPRVVEAAANAAGRLPKVESVQADLGWYRRLAILSETAAQAIAPTAIVLVVLLLAVVLGAVRVTAAIDFAELRVLHQIGADRDFMRRPSIYAGAVTLGLAAASSLGLAAFVHRVAGSSVAELGGAFGLELSLAFPPWPLVIAFVAANLLIGATAARYFTGRSIARSLK